MTSRRRSAPASCPPARSSRPTPGACTRRQPRTNALACDRFADALADAEAADERIAAAGPDDALPPFLGVPCTIKESIALRGMPNCAGMVALRDRRSETTAPAAQRLIDAGFIPLGVTNTSELTMWIESVNRVYGRTRNAYDPRRTAGGSSGGEGAAVGSGGSPVGLGSDIARLDPRARVLQRRLRPQAVAGPACRTRASSRTPPARRRSCSRSGRSPATPRT